MTKAPEEEPLLLPLEGDEEVDENVGCDAAGDVPLVA